MNKENKSNQVIERIAVLENSYRHYFHLLEQKNKECLLLQDENKRLREQLEASRKKLDRLKESNYLVAV